MIPAIALLLACGGNKTIDPAPAAPTPVQQSRTVPELTTHTPTASRAAPSAAYPARAAKMTARFQGVLGGNANSATSGVSASFALGMLAVGASDSTSSAFEDLFDAPLSEVQVDHARALAAYNDTMGVKLSVSNGLWPDEGTTFKPEVLSTLSSTFNARAQPLPFSRAPAEAAQLLNAWTDRNTNGLIPELMSASDLNGAKLVLVNTIAFKGKWKHPFQTSATTEQPFAAPAGSTNVPMMLNPKVLAPFVESEDYKAILLPYAGDSMSMAFILPNPGTSLADAQQALAATDLAALASATPRNIHLTVPRFEIRSEHDLIANAEDLGLSSVLDGTYPGFNGLRVSQAIQKVVVIVNEEGTEASAATAVTMKRGGAPRTIPFHLDRPFLFVVWHHETQTPLFVGQVVAPQ